MTNGFIKNYDLLQEDCRTEVHCRSIWYASFLYAVEYGDISNITNGFKNKLESITKSSIIPLIAQFSSKEED